MEHFLFSDILGMSSSQLTHIFQRGRSTTNQLLTIIKSPLNTIKLRILMVSSQHLLQPCSATNPLRQETLWAPRPWPAPGPCTRWSSACAGRRPSTTWKRSHKTRCHVPRPGVTGRRPVEVGWENSGGYTYIIYVLYHSYIYIYIYIHISYHIISYHIISYHIISYHIISYIII